jgi:hypothetical protein
MPLAQIEFLPPGIHGWDEWAFNHAQDHIEIVGGVKQYANFTLPIYNLDPIPQDRRAFLLAHQQAHNDMNSFFSLPGSDLMDVDWRDPLAVRAFLYLNFSEHQAVRLRIGI